METLALLARIGCPGNRKYLQQTGVPAKYPADVQCCPGQCCAGCKSHLYPWTQITKNKTKFCSNWRNHKVISIFLFGVRFPGVPVLSRVSHKVVLPPVPAAQTMLVLYLRVEVVLSVQSCLEMLVPCSVLCWAGTIMFTSSTAQCRVIESLRRGAASSPSITSEPCRPHSPNRGTRTI
jgi:hypothetical protein